MFPLIYFSVVAILILIFGFIWERYNHQEYYELMATGLLIVVWPLTLIFAAIFLITTTIFSTGKWLARKWNKN